MAPACASSQGSLAVRLHVWYCPPSSRLWQANSNPCTSTSHQTPSDRCSALMPSVKSADLAVLHLRIRTDASNVWSGFNTYTYTRWDRLFSLVLKNLAIFSEYAIFLPVSPLLCVLFQYQHPWLIMSRWLLPEFNSDLNWNRSPLITFCHHPPHTPPLHSSISPLFSPLLSPAISLPHWMSHSRIIQHNENSAATQNSSLCAPRGMTTTARDGDGGTGGSPSAWAEKKGWNLSSTDRIKRIMFCSYQESLVQHRVTVDILV